MKRLLRFMTGLMLLIVMTIFLPQAAEAAQVTASGTFGENIDWILTDDGTLTITGTGAIPAQGVTTTPWYEYNEQVTTVVIGDGITDTGLATFANYHQLEKAVIGDDVTVIGDSLFYYCWNLTEVELGKGVQSIVGASFLFTSITELDLPEGLTQIGPYTFASCFDLESIAIPASVTVIGDGAFQHCDNLGSVYYGGTQAQWDAIDIKNTVSDSQIAGTIHYESNGIPKTGDALTIILPLFLTSGAAMGLIMRKRSNPPS